MLGIAVLKVIILLVDDVTEALEAIVTGMLNPLLWTDARDAVATVPWTFEAVTKDAVAAVVAFAGT